jgi:adenosylhomocysteine nucleosidase
MARSVGPLNGFGVINTPRESGLSDSCKVAIVAALEREVWPLVKDWRTIYRLHQGRRFKFFQHEGAVLVCGGIGAEAARRAAEAIITLYTPALVISAGFAGGLDPALRAGHALTPRLVIDAADGSRSDSGNGEGVLVSFGEVADSEQKASLAKAYGADVVDMEAAAVARCAQAHGIQFTACKVVSDSRDQRLPPVGRFMAADGQFQSFRFLAHVALRPWLWVGVGQLARNTAIAAQSLCKRLAASTQ